jgi:hypothetical protein
MGVACGEVRAACGETVEVCSQAYRCDCETCSDVPDYASRMSQDRSFNLTGSSGWGGVDFKVTYDGGRCQGVGDPRYGGAKICMVSAWDDSDLGGCHRHMTDPGTGIFLCGDSKSVCGGVRVECDCSDGGQALRVSDAHRVIPPDDANAGGDSHRTQ